MTVQSILFVSPMTLGKETEVRELHQDFPFEALAQGNAVESIAAYVGSGFYALQIDVSDGDFQQRFHEFVRTPEIQAFFGRAGEFIDELPAANEQTAEIPLAAPILYWERGMSS